MSNIQNLLEDISIQNQMLHEALLSLDLTQAILQFLGLHHLSLPTDSLAVYLKNNKLTILLASGAYLSRLRPLLGDLEIYLLKNKAFSEYFFPKNSNSGVTGSHGFIIVKIKPILNKTVERSPAKIEVIHQSNITQSNKDAINVLAKQIKNPRLQQVLLKIAHKKT